MVVVGGGHNGLVASALLAKKGLKVLVLESRAQVGGAAVTEEFHPGFRASTVAHTAGPLRPSVIAELGLREPAFIEPEPRCLALLPDGGSLALFGDPARTAEELRRHSPQDAGRYPEFHRSLTTVARFLSRLTALTPPDVASPFRDPWGLLGTAWGFRRLGRRDGQRLLRWGPMAVADFAAEWFETEILRATVAARGIYGAFAGPWSAGTTANLLLRAAADGGNAAGSTVFVRGGLGRLADALADGARRFGAEIRTGTPVERITTRNGSVSGVVIAGGDEIEAGAVVSAVDPRRTFQKLLDPALLDPEDAHRIRNFRCDGVGSKVNLALSALPSFKAARGASPEALLSGRLHIGPEIDALERAFDEAKYGGLSSQPYLDVTIPTLTDPELAPPGRHVMSVYAQYTPYRLREGDWRTRKAEVETIVLRTLEEYAPGISSLVERCQVLTPLDLEETYGLTGGHHSHGETSLDQLFLARPLLGWGRYRGPVSGLYLCSAGTHPGGGVTGASGANAAREILRDLD